METLTPITISREYPPWVWVPLGNLKKPIRSFPMKKAMWCFVYNSYSPLTYLSTSRLYGNNTDSIAFCNAHTLHTSCRRRHSRRHAVLVEIASRVPQLPRHLQQFHDLIYTEGVLNLRQITIHKITFTHSVKTLQFHIHTSSSVSTHFWGLFFLASAFLFLWSSYLAPLDRLTC